MRFYVGRSVMIVPTASVESDTWETLLPKVISKHYATFRD